MSTERNGIKCDSCRGDKFRVLWVRHKGGCVIRMRECIQCKHRRKTVEK